MKKPRALKVLLAFSAVLLLVTGGMWMRSLFREDSITLAAWNRRLWVRSAGQKLWIKGAFSFERELTVDGSTAQNRSDSLQLLPSYQTTAFSRHLVIPYWLVVLPTALLPGYALLARAARPRRSRRRSRPRRALAPRRA